MARAPPAHTMQARLWWDSSVRPYVPCGLLARMAASASNPLPDASHTAPIVCALCTDECDAARSHVKLYFVQTSTRAVSAASLLHTHARGDQLVEPVPPALSRCDASILLFLDSLATRMK